MVSLYVHMNVIFLLWYYDLLLISIVAVQFGLMSTLLNTDRTQGTFFAFIQIKSIQYFRWNLCGQGL